MVWSRLPPSAYLGVSLGAVELQLRVDVHRRVQSHRAASADDSLMMIIPGRKLSRRTVLAFCEAGCPLVVPGRRWSCSVLS
jgi:hypothetical protein